MFPRTLPSWKKQAFLKMVWMWAKVRVRRQITKKRAALMFKAVHNRVIWIWSISKDQNIRFVKIILHFEKEINTSKGKMGKYSGFRMLWSTIKRYFPFVGTPEDFTHRSKIKKQQNGWSEDWDYFTILLFLFL